MPFEPEATRNLMINYIPTAVDEGHLRILFSQYGPIESLKIVYDRETRESRGYGFVKYRYGLSAVQAIQYLNGYPLTNKRLKVSFANAQEAMNVAMTPNTEEETTTMEGDEELPVEQKGLATTAGDEVNEEGKVVGVVAGGVRVRIGGGGEGNTTTKQQQQFGAYSTPQYVQQMTAMQMLYYSQPGGGY